MRHDQMISVTTGTLDADPARRHAMIVHAFEAARAISAADPGADQAILSDWRVLRLRPCCDYRAEGLMPQRHRRMHSAIAHVQSLAAAQIEVAFADVHIAVAHPAVLELQQHFGT